MRSVVYQLPNFNQPQGAIVQGQSRRFGGYLRTGIAESLMQSTRFCYSRQRRNLVGVIPGCDIETYSIIRRGGQLPR